MSTQLKILVGLIFTLLICIPLAAIALEDLGHEVGIVPEDQATEMGMRAAAVQGREIESGADVYEQYCYGCHGKRGDGIPQVAPAINRKDLLDGRYERGIGWSGSVDAFIANAIGAGRPIQSRLDLYVARMPTWSHEYGGPLHPDQVSALVAFVTNWRDQAPEVNAYPPPPTPQPTRGSGIVPTPAPSKAALIPVCQNIPLQYAGKQAPFKFDDRAVLAAGKQTYDTRCAACHGSTGKGDGPAAAALSPKPANLTDKAFMQGMPVECQFYVISEGVKGTGMPPWKSLGDDAIWRVLIYQRSFSGVQ